MKQRPILFSTPMVQVILAGRKTQTRRIINPQPIDNTEVDGNFYEGNHNGYVKIDAHPNWREQFALEFSPYGKVCDILWVREEHYRIGHWEEVLGVKTKSGRQKWRFIPDGPEVRYFDNPPESFRKGRHGKDPSTSVWHKRLARFMPKSACRIFLKNTGVWLERLNAITDDNAIAEGIQCLDDGELPVLLYKDYMADSSGYGHPDHDFPTVFEPIESYKSLWQSINGLESWEANPWVWVIEFDKIEKI